MLKFMCFYFTPSSRSGIIGSDAHYVVNIFLGGTRDHIILHSHLAISPHLTLLLRCEVVCFGSLDLHFPNGYNGWASFFVLMEICMSLESSLFKSFFL